MGEGVTFAGVQWCESELVGEGWERVWHLLRGVQWGESELVGGGWGGWGICWGAVG